MNILVLGGGGSRGCYQAGFLYEVFDKIKFERIYGTSTGSLNALILAQCYLEGKKDKLKDIWTDKINNRKDIFKYNYLKILLLDSPCHYNPLKKLLDQNIDFNLITKMRQLISLTTTDLVSGKSIFFSNKYCSGERFRDISLASASIPPAFSPVHVGGLRLVDGGIRENIPLQKAIQDLKEKNQENHKVIILACGKQEPEKNNNNNYNIFESSLRAVDIMMNEISKNDIFILEKINDIIDNIEDEKSKLSWMKNKKKINFYLSMPDEPITSGVLNFDKEELQKGFKKGQEAGKKYLDIIY